MHGEERQEEIDIEEGEERSGEDEYDGEELKLCGDSKRIVYFFNRPVMRRIVYLGDLVEGNDADKVDDCDDDDDIKA